MSLRNKLTQLRGLLDGLQHKTDPNALQAVPPHWLERDYDFEFQGPAPDENPTPGQLLVFEQLKAMDAATIGARPGLQSLSESE